MTDTPPVLQADNLVVKKGDVKILRNISIVVPPESQILIQGPSGAGKSTLFEVLGLLSRPSGGELYVDEQRVSTLSERELARLRRHTIGLIFQDFRLIPDLTAWENARLPLEHGTGDPDDDRLDWLTTVFELLGITELTEQYPPSLSGGEKQRVAIARALANEPDVILADEPTGQLDPNTASRVRELLLRVQNESQTALLVISHDRSFEDHLANVYQLQDGRLS